MARNPLKPRVILLRQPAANAKWAPLFEAAGATTLSYPMIEFTQCDRAIRQFLQVDLSPFTHIILTSQSSLPYLSQLPNWPHLHRLPVWAIGQETATAAKTYGLTVEWTSPVSSISGMRIHFPPVAGRHFLWPTTPQSGTWLPRSIRQLGGKIYRFGIYKTQCPDTPPIPLFDSDWVLFSSGSTAHHFFRRHPTITVRPICFGKTTEKILIRYHQPPPWIIPPIRDQHLIFPSSGSLNSHVATSKVSFFSSKHLHSPLHDRRTIFDPSS